ncbi:shikimate kinase [Nocardia tenerifensis]|uniref:Shikimate kinase n=1 Tax=Nocardia tenerifensis TaxID=228006 RepID=A0A318K5Z9_9NOCA|nr:AAA family ATPase [Nocardia tenerifensis]PXX58704.1 shikimate kinase [Nocardia tenerifensis]
MAAVLITGMSGVGKSTVLNLLSQKGFRVVDTDADAWIEQAPALDGVEGERQWREDRIDTLLVEHERSGEPLFIGGTVRNQTRFYARFDHIVLLSAPIDVMLERIAARDSNPFGKTAEERQQIISDTAEVVPLLRLAATVEIDTRRPLSDVVSQLIALAR